jgi:hypothetical protein
MNVFRTELTELSKITIDEVTDPAEIARAQAQHERHRRNVDWLESHWDGLLPQARGRFVAIANQQASIADTAQEAWAWIKSHHADDNGAFVHYVPRHTGPRIYANRG